MKRDEVFVESICISLNNDTLARGNEEKDFAKEQNIVCHGCAFIILQQGATNHIKHRLFPIDFDQKFDIGQSFFFVRLIVNHCCLFIRCIVY